MLGQQKSPIQQRNLDAMRRVSSGQGGNRPGLSSPLSSSAARYQDIEVPLGGATELNDDAKEKRLRRMSDMNDRVNRRLSFRPFGAAGGSGSGSAAGEGGEHGSAGNNLSSPSSSKLRPSGPSSLLGVVDSLQAPLPMPVSVSMDSFEQWLKLATDNKINVHNSWNLALIDYFHDMSVLREGDSINFQKASCTLDGCVKVYTSRVDSVATETTKLLGGLATSAKGRQGEAEVEEGDDDDDETDKPKKKRHSTRSGNTLAKDFSSLSLEKFNLEFSVDPLFKKTSADFDEGGARGLLLNHLSIDAEGKIIFDAGDARDEGDDDDDDEDEDGKEEDEPRTPTDEEETRPKFNRKSSEVESSMIDIQRLRSKFLPSLNQIFSKDICPSLRDFQLSGSSELDFSFVKRLHGDGDGDEETGHATDNDDIFGGGGDDDDDDGFDNDFDSPADVYDDLDQDQAMEFNQSNTALGDDMQVEDAFGDLDAQIAARQSGPAVEKLMADNTEEISGKDPADMYEYLDSAFLRNWAGPEHWKLRRPRKDKKADPNAVPEEGAPEEEEAAPKKKGGRAPLVINFLEADEVDEDELFAPAEASSLLLPAGQLADSRKATYLLPDDIHFSSKQLLRMFMKPAFIMKSKNKKPQSGFLQQNEDPEPFALTFPDEEFWASHTNNVNDGDMTALTDQLDQTQIYNDYDEEDDDYGSQDQGFFAGPGGNGLGGIIGFGLDGDGNDYASQMVAQPKRVKSTSINFSKTAKKVDVKKLKDNIWKEMTQQSLKRQVGRDDHDRRRNKKANVEGDDGEDDNNERDQSEEEDDDDDGDGEYVKKEQRFTEIIGGLSKVYPEHKLRDISVPFCFICLLHLANEKDLEIEGSENLNELVVRHN